MDENITSLLSLHKKYLPKLVDGVDRIANALEMLVEK
jgi:hypothetical protein